MPEFAPKRLETGKMHVRSTDSTDKSTYVSTVSAPLEDSPEKTDDLADEQHAFLADLPVIEGLDETVARILALTDDQRALYYAELIHDWRAWRFAMANFNGENEL
jgi:hypothetical protein